MPCAPTYSIIPHTYTHLPIHPSMNPPNHTLTHTQRAQGFTSRPPSRLPAFGSAQSAQDLQRHAAAARKAVLRDCGAKEDCAWMHELDAHELDARHSRGPQAAIAQGVLDDLHSHSTRGRAAPSAGPSAATSARTSQTSLRAGRSRGGAAVARAKGREDAEEAMVRDVLAKEVALGKQGGHSKKMETEENALLWEVKALLAQKQLVKEQVGRLMKQAASSSSPHAAHASAVFNQLQTILGTTFDKTASPSSVLARAHTAAKLAKEATRAGQRMAAPASNAAVTAATSATTTAGAAMPKDQQIKEEKAAAEAQRARQRVEVARKEEEREQEEHSRRARAEQQRVSRREEARAAEAARERAHEEAEGWVHVDKFVAPWDPCASGEAEAASDAVREYRSMCRDLALIRKATAPAHRLGLLSLVASRPVTAAWSVVADVAGQASARGGEQEERSGVGGKEGEGDLEGVLARVNAKQASLNRRRLKLYIKIFGAPYKGEVCRCLRVLVIAMVRVSTFVRTCMHACMHACIHGYICAFGVMAASASHLSSF